MGGPEQKRAVQVIARRQDGTDWFGSGYLVTSDLVITAQHVLGDADDVTVRFIDASGQVRNEPGNRVWADVSVDMAVVRLLAVIPNLAAVQPVQYGRLIAEAECEAVGYPWFKLRGEDAQAYAVYPGKFRDSHHARATCTPLSNTRSGTLELAVAAAPSRHPDPNRSAWEGMSGAAVFAYGALIAVLTDNFPKEGPGLLTARPVEHWYTLPPDLLSELRGLIGVPGADRLIQVSAQLPPWPAPKQLPARHPFVGREKELSQLLDLLAPSSASAPTVGAGVAAVVGLPGVGKTALVTEAAHLARERGWFPGGQLFLDLRGYDPEPISAYDALGQLLPVLGVSASDIQIGEQARATQFRSKLAQSDVPLLIVLDNVSLHALQVKPLVPDKGPHRLLVTSRHSLPQLDARLLQLDVLSPDESVALMNTVMRNRSEDDNRVQEQPVAAAEVARLCGYLPLALRIATALPVAAPPGPLTELVAELAVQRARIDRLNDGENALRPAFDLSYQRLAPDEAMLFRLLSLNGNPDISLAAAAAVVGLTEEAAKAQLDRLVATHLLDRTTDRPRWTTHDLLWEYAALAVDKEDSDLTREAARGRLLDYYNRICALAADQIMPDAESGQTPNTGHFESSAAALDWLDRERANLIAATISAAQHQQDAVAVALADHLSYYLRSQRRFAEKVTTDQVRLDIARRHHDHPVAADALCTLGVSLHLLSRFAEAADCYQQALVIDRELKSTSRLREARDLVGLGRAQRGLREFDAAEANLRAAGDLRATARDHGGQRRALNELAMTLIAAGRDAEAAQIWKDMAT